MAKTRTTTKVVRKRKKGGITAKTLASWTSQFVAIKEQQKQARARYDDLRKRIQGALEEHGYTDADGHRYLDIEGVEGVTHLKQERRVSRSLDEDAALALIEKKGLPRKKFVKTVEMLDQDALYAALYEEDENGKPLISEKELDSLVTENVSWAVKEVTE